MTKDSTVVTQTASGKPLQLISYNEKEKDDFAVMKATAKFFIDGAMMNKIHKFDDSSPDMGTKKSLYDAYNNVIPESLFNYVTNPINTTNEKFKKFPAKIRSYNILRPNIDLLLGEWNKRGFRFDVVNADGDDVFNSFLDSKEKAYKNNIVQRFINHINEQQETGLPTEEIPSPKRVIIDLNNNYKDEKALRGYRALKVLELELKLKEVWRTLMKDWLIAGEAYTFKFPHLSEIEYGRLSPLWVDYDKSNLSPYVEDGEWAVAAFRMTPSEVVDMFYKDLTKKQIEENVEGAELNMFKSAFSAISAMGGNENDTRGKVDVYYCVWKSKTKIGFLSYKDPFTGEEVMDVVDESYVPDKELGEEVEWMWVNEVWHAWRIGDNEYVRIEPLPAQRNEMNNFSKCKLSINGKRFSDTESMNVSPLYLGLPYQIMYIIMMYRIELTIARSKGKIVLMDRALINDEDGEDQFIYYAEGLGWALVDREQEGVDKSWNGYQVLDLSLFKDIKELINIADWIKTQWDELLGITRQRKGQLSSSDGLGASQESIFRSSVISDIIFTGFEEFLECELQGLLDLTKFAWIDGKKAYYRNDDGRLEFFAAEPENYVHDDYSVFAINSSTHTDKLNALKQQINAIAQRKDIKTTTIVDLIWTESITELKAKLRQAEAIEEENIMKQAQNEQAGKEALEKMKQDYMQFQQQLDLEKLHAEWDRRDNNEIIKKSLDKDPGAGIDDYLGEVEKQSTERLKRMEESRSQDADRQVKREENQIKREKIASDERIAKDKNRVALKNKVSGEK